MNIAIITARGGSKRIKNKNIKNFFGKPIIAYSINLALKSKIFKEVIVSTNDKKIMQISKKYGAKVLFKRPNNLSKNGVPIVDVISHALKKISKKNLKPSFVCCIFPVSPFITKKILVSSYNTLKKKKLNYIFPVTRKTYSNQNKLYIYKKKISKNKKKSQTFFDAGQFYWGSETAWKKKLNIFGLNSGIMYLSSKKFLDVNNMKDWKILEKNYKNEKKRKRI